MRSEEKYIERYIYDDMNVYDVNMKVK